MKKINKIALLLTVCIVSVALVLVLAACDDPSDEHQHSWSAWSLATEPTQDTVGSVTRTCSADGCTYGGGVQSVEIPALSSDLYTAGADTATCGEAGTKTYSVTVPGYEDVFTFSVVSAAKGNHTLSPKSAVAATCTKQGAEAYWECDICHKKFSDENGANEISAPVATAINPDKHTIVPHNRIEAKCNADGCEAYWECTDCGKLYKQPVYTTDNEIEEPVVINKTPNTHKLTPHAATTAKCNADGNIAYWTCDDCGKYFSDAQGTTEITQEETVISMSTVDHTPVPLPDTATCTTDGYKACWQCEVCGQLFKDEACTVKIDEREVSPAHHNLPLTSVGRNTLTAKAVTNSAGTKVTYNNVAYYECADCHKKFYEAAGTNEITTVMAASYYGMLLSQGDNKAYLYSSANRRMVGFFAEVQGQYTFEMQDDFAAVRYLDTTAATATTMYQNSAWVTTNEIYSKFVDTTANGLKKVVVNMSKGDIIAFGYAADGLTSIKVTGGDPVLYYGDNSVYIKSDDLFDENVYTFMPTESKYSMTVAEGLYVMMNGDEFADAGNGETTVNFECTPGQEVTFSFSGSVIGTYAVTIGEFVKPLTLEVGTPVELSVNNDGAVLQQGQAMTTIVIDESVAAGTYKLTVSCNIMQAQLLLGLNYQGSANDFVGTTWLDGAADIYWGFNQGQNLNGNSKITGVTPGNRTGATATIELQAGDVLTFLTNNRAAFNVTLTLEAVA